MKKENKTVLFISHDLEELMEVCSKLIVLRDGVFVAELEKSEFEEEKIKELMVGRKLTGDYYRSDYDFSCRIGGAISHFPADVISNVVSPIKSSRESSLMSWKFHTFHSSRQIFKSLSK